MTKEAFMEINLNQISQVYNGKRDCCRCGCGGIYVATSFMADPRSDVNDVRAERFLKRAKKLISEGAEYMMGDTYIDVRSGNDRSITLYFDEIGKTEIRDKKITAIIES